MCQFFSFCSDGKGNFYYFNSDQRKTMLQDVNSTFYPDSHASICAFFNINEDQHNKYEYNPLTCAFDIDQINTINDSQKAKTFAKHLNFQKIIPELVIKKIVNPFKDIQKTKVTQKDIHLLKEWSSVWDSVWDSVGDSVWGYISSFFKIEYDYDFSSCVLLWERGLVPSFDGATWRLHGENGKILYPIPKTDLKNH